MRTALKISLVVNLSLLAGLFLMWISWREESAVSLPPPGRMAEPPAPVAEVSPKPAALTRSVEAPKFNWSQLESLDDRTYVKNLRNIGCPETALRAIVSATVEAKYRQRSDELQQKLAVFDKSSWSEKLSSLNSRPAWLAELQKLPGEKTAEIASLLGIQRASQPEFATGVAPLSANGTAPSVQASAALQSQPSDTTAGAEASAGSQFQADENAPSLVADNRPGWQPSRAFPLVYREVDPTVLNLDDQQAQTVNELRQDFVEAIGGPNQDPADPAYLKRWRVAQPQADAELKSRMGILGWEAYQVATWNP